VSNNRGCPHIPDFLCSFVGSLNFMRLSLMKGAHAVLSRAAYRNSGHLDFEMWEMSGSGPLSFSGYRHRCEKALIPAAGEFANQVDFVLAIGCVVLLENFVEPDGWLQ
jgi:hypothetical protein